MRARFYPIISSMEIMRRKVMARIAENKAKSENWSGTICPNIFKKLKLNVKNQIFAQHCTMELKDLRLWKGSTEDSLSTWIHLHAAADIGTYLVCHVAMLLVLYTQ